MIPGTEGGSTNTFLMTTSFLLTSCYYTVTKDSIVAFLTISVLIITFVNQLLILKNKLKDKN